MTQKEKLIERLVAAPERKRMIPAYAIKKVADYLIDNGVVVLPCKAGDTVYQVDLDRTIVEREVMHFIVQNDCISFAFYIPGFGEYITAKDEKVFLTREEAEAALKGEKYGERRSNRGT